MTQIDISIMECIRQNMTSPLMDKIMTAITHMGDYGILWIGLCIILMAVPKTRKSGFALATAMIAGLVICNLLMKNIIARPRPFVAYDFPIIINPPMGYSFPSGHSSNSFIAATVIAMGNKKLALPAYIIAILIAFSRVYLCVHYPSDIIAGAVIGMGIGCATVRLFDKYNGKL
jgi:undecaprenyl-diphosphatase